MSVEDRSPLEPGEVGLCSTGTLRICRLSLPCRPITWGYADGNGGFEIVGRAAKDGDRISREPSTRTVGPMGDKPLPRVLEAYVNFSIDFKVGRVRPKKVASSTAELEDWGPGAAPSCPILVDDIIASAEDPAAAARVDEAWAVLVPQRIDLNTLISLHNDRTRRPDA